MSPTATPAATPTPTARTRILDSALGLMSERGAAGTSMRLLAGACGLNVATIYHYFPSKDDVLKAVIAERRYHERLAAVEPPIDPALPPGERLAALVTWMWDATRSEESVLRLILGEGLRGDAGAQESARALVTILDDGLARWMAEGFPELRGRGVDPAVAGRLVRRQLLALVAEQLAAGRADGDAAAAELATALLGGGDAPGATSPGGWPRPG